MIVPQQSEPPVMSVANMIAVAIILLIGVALIVISIKKSFKKKK